MAILLSIVLMVSVPNPQTTPSAEVTAHSQASNPSQVAGLKAKAQAGDAEAENALGVMYRMGEGVGQDKQEAVRWYRSAAKHGSAKAMFNLGAAYYNGDGVGVDDVRSCAWFVLAQQAGYPGADEAVHRATLEKVVRPIEAFETIGEMYEAGDELPKSTANALKWYRKAADGGAPQAAVNAAAILANGSSPTLDDLTEARTRCGDAASSHYAPGDYCMAVIYRSGLGVAKDPEETAKWLARAADLGHPKAVLQLGEAYWKGDGVKPNLTTAYMWIWLAYRSKVPGADRDEGGLRKEMRQKDVEKAKKNADSWAMQHRLLVLHTDKAADSNQ